MAIAQSDFTLWRSRGYEGQISTIDVNDVISRRVDGELLAFGRAVMRGEKARSCAPVTAATKAADIIGFSVRSIATTSNTPPTNTGEYEAGYHDREIASIIRRGRFYAKCVDGAEAGDVVHVLTAAGENLGRLSTKGGVALNQCSWIEDTEAGEIGEIQIDGILTTE